MKLVIPVTLLLIYLNIGCTLFALPYSIPNTEVMQIKSRHTGINYILYVSLPKSYQQHNKNYPVLFTLDADYSFPIAQSTVKHFVDRNNLPPMIIVSIAYAGASQNMAVYRANRIRDYMPTKAPLGTCGSDKKYKKGSGGGKEFLKFIRNELIPYTEKNYRVKKNDRTIVGHSAGGLFGTFVLLTKPDTFQRYILVSPSLWWDNKLAFKLEQTFSLKNKSLSANVFYSIGRWENPKVCPMVSQMNQFVKKLKSRKYKNLKIDSYVFPHETHNSVFPAALSRGLRVVFEKM
jgi:predicted alpha/beta superfamily hydrolase